MIDKREMLIALAREEHFGRAADSLGLTQPTLSAGIKSLEGQLGVQLVRRGSRFGGLTPEGARVLIWARRIVGDTRTMREEMRAAHRGLSGEVRLAVIPTALTMAAQLTASFQKAHPGVRLSVVSRTSVEILAMLENLEVDGGISYLDNEPLGRVTAVPIYQENYALVCPAGHPLARATRVPWAALAGQPLCLLTPDMQNRRIINQNFQAAGVEVTPTIESNSTVVLVAHVQTGGWVTILPTKLAEFLTSDPSIATVPMEPPARRPQVGLIAAEREPHTPVMAALIAAARGMAES